MPDRPESACPGYCCAAFYWPRTLADMRKHPERFYDGDKIADMLVPLTPKEARERYLGCGFVGGVSTEERMRLREEQIGAEKPGETLA